ncbi:hypothetical protein NOGI109294_02350 [Nocardiopsis gilva]|uniref:hypothetical protein n=1 Tax=Nocardiopsis gilva TaxID=280236 RepID=UPI000348FE7E|nr:hypothetical protein [Nocardiopsis gilva]
MNSKLVKTTTAVAASAVLTGTMLMGATPATAATSASAQTPHGSSKFCPYVYWYYGWCTPIHHHHR